MSARPPRNNSIGSLSFSLVGIVGVLAVVIAGATIWLVLTDPVTVAESVDAGEVSPLIRSLAGAIFDALKGLLKYLGWRLGRHAISFQFTVSSSKPALSGTRTPHFAPRTRFDLTTDNWKLTRSIL
jgi:hypothetical protein